MWALELERVRNHLILALHFTKVEAEAQRESMPCPTSYGYYETEVILELESPDFFTPSAPSSFPLQVSDSQEMGNSSRHNVNLLETIFNKIC